MNTVIDFGHFTLGSAPTFTFVFKQDGAATDPESAVLNVTMNGVKTAQTLNHAGAGTYTWTPVLTVSGFYFGTAYAPPGAGETAQPFTFAVDADPNYP